MPLIVNVRRALPLFVCGVASILAGLQIRCARRCAATSGDAPCRLLRSP